MNEVCFALWSACLNRCQYQITEVASLMFCFPLNFVHWCLHSIQTCSQLLHPAYFFIITSNKDLSPNHTPYMYFCPQITCLACLSVFSQGLRQRQGVPAQCHDQLPSDLWYVCKELFCSVMQNRWPCHLRMPFGNVQAKWHLRASRWLPVQRRQPEVLQQGWRHSVLWQLSPVVGGIITSCQNNKQEAFICTVIHLWHSL